MLDRIVRYLHESRVPFRLASYPSAEHAPEVGHPMPPHAVLVDVRCVTLGGRLILVCVRDGDRVDLAALGNDLGAVAMDALPDDLPDAFIGANGDVPPLGEMFDLPLIVDEAVENCQTVVFRAAGGSAYFEIPYEDFARQERPRVASFARAGELETGLSSRDTRPTPSAPAFRWPGALPASHRRP